MAKLILDYYKNEDLYSDGDVEDKILAIVESGNDIYSENDYAIVYHLSHLRQNILNWYKFKQGSSVLEIGSGCGAITGLLCQKCSKVVSVELSKRRATINYKRHERMENLEIMVGNLNDMTFSQKFDYIVLNGVLEYAISFTEGEKPYETFLATICKLLNPNGIVLIAIENRIGLKYFAGAEEDHLGTHFTGINQYQGINNVRTFSKEEMMELLKRVGFKHQRFFYPYPDYKFPKEIFSDDSIQNMGYGRDVHHFEKNRLHLFDMDKMFQTLTKEQVVSTFANSFLIETSLDDILGYDNFVYAKLSNDRKEEFCIGTTIEKNGFGEKVVKKYPLSIESKNHIENMKKNTLENEIIFNLENTSDEEGIVTYPFLEAISLDEILYQKAIDNQIEDIMKNLMNIQNIISKSSIKAYPTHDEQFCKVFGDEPADDERICISPCNIDLILDNIFDIDGKYCVIDYEWVFEFPVPVGFVMWRMVNEWYAKHSDVGKYIKKDDIFSFLGIDKNDQYIFKIWTLHFENVYVGGGRLNSYYGKDISVSLDDTDNLPFYYDRILESKLYYDVGDGFSEDNIIPSKTYMEDGNFYVEYTIKDIDKIKKLRWDPVERPCSCELFSVKVDGQDVEINSNANEKFDAKDRFYHLDPQYILSLKTETIHEVVFEGKIHVYSNNKALKIIEKCRNEEYEKFEKQVQETQKRDGTINELEILIQQLKYMNEQQEVKIKQQEIQFNQVNKELSNIKNSKIWRYTAFLRRG